MAVKSTAMIKYAIESAAESNRIMDEREDIGEHKAGSGSWYAYLAGRMSAQLESMAETLTQLITDDD